MSSPYLPQRQQQQAQPTGYSYIEDQSKYPSHQVNSNPAPYASSTFIAGQPAEPYYSGKAAQSFSDDLPWWNPRGWSRRIWLIAGTLLVVIIIAAAIGGVEGSKDSFYPDYSALNYTLTETYEGANFFQNFQYWDTYDPAAGFVHYSNPEEAVQMNLTYASDSSAVLRVDNTQNNASTGRLSARVSSVNTYNDGLFIFDILHTPYGCATWPAVWLTDQYHWPTNGEIDVIEAINQATSGNQMTLHTTQGCTMNVKREQSGSAIDSNCWNGTNADAGCGVKAPSNTFGSALNSQGGGVYAMELRTAGIRVWFWERGSIPADITNGTSPTPDTWGTALADFPSTNCDIGSHFQNLSIVANIDVCGNWAGSTSVYSGQDNCPQNCTAYAANNPSAFDNAYWEFASFKVYSAA